MSLDVGVFTKYVCYIIIMSQAVWIQVGTIYQRYGRRNTFIVWEILGEDSIFGCTVYSLNPPSINTTSGSSESLSSHSGLKIVHRMSLEDMITGLVNGRIEDEITTPVSESAIEALRERYDASSFEFTIPIS